MIDFQKYQGIPSFQSNDLVDLLKDLRLDYKGYSIFKGTRGGKSSEPEVVVVIPIYCETC